MLIRLSVQLDGLLKLSTTHGSKHRLKLQGWDRLDAVFISSTKGIFMQVSHVHVYSESLPLRAGHAINLRAKPRPGQTYGRTFLWLYEYTREGDAKTPLCAMCAHCRNSKTRFYTFNQVKRSYFGLRFRCICFNNMKFNGNTLKGIQVLHMVGPRSTHAQ